MNGGWRAVLFAKRASDLTLPLLVGTRDGRTQSARAWLSGPEFQDLDKRTLGFRTSIDGQLGSGFQDLDRRTDGDLSVKIVGTRDGRTQSARAWLPGPEFQDLEKRTLGFRTSINGHWVSGPRQTDSWDLGFRTSKQSAKQKTRGRRGSHLSSFLKKTRSCVRPSVRAGFATENASRWSVIDRAGSAVENASRTPNHPRT